jgi:NitT/TauT family transport system permease protein
MKQARRIEAWAPWVLIVLALVVWQALISAFRVSEFVFPGPIAIARALVEFARPIGQHAWQTFWTTMIGFAIGVLVGAALGAIVGSSRMMYRALYPLLVGFNSVPKAAVVPILVVWCGIGTVPAILTAFLICFFPIVVNVATGLATVEPELEDVLRALGATKRDILFKVGFPRSTPYFFASLKVAITLAFVGTVISETVAANVGIGYLMMSAGSSMKMPLVFAGLLIISAMAMIMYELFAWLERRVTGWATRGMDAAQ